MTIVTPPKKKIVVKKPKPSPKCSYCKGAKKTVKKGSQSGGCGCAGIATPPA